jgi:hypothetical protein
VSKTFPTVGLIADGPTAWMYAAPARSLGIDLVYLDTQEEVQSGAQKCEVVSIVDQSISLNIAKRLEVEGTSFTFCNVGSKRGNEFSSCSSNPDLRDGCSLATWSGNDMGTY